MINYDVHRGVSVKNDRMGSTLTLTDADADDSGNYTCSPYNVRPSSVVVHVLSKGNSAEAVQNKDKNNGKNLQLKDNDNAPPSAAVQSNGCGGGRSSFERLAALLAAVTMSLAVVVNSRCDTM